MFRRNTLLFCLLGALVAWSFTTSSEVLPKSANPNIMKLEMGRNTWVDISKSFPGDITCSSVYNNELILGKEDGLYRAKLDGQKLKFVKEPMMEDAVFSIITTQAGNTYIHTMADGLHYRPKHTAIWMKAYDVVGDSKIRTVWEEPDGLVLAGGVHGIYRSANGGGEWTQVLADTHVHNFEVKGSTYFAGTGKGLAVSKDQGLNWEFIGEFYQDIMSVKSGANEVATIVYETDEAPLPRNQNNNYLFIYNMTTGEWKDVSHKLPKYKAIHDLIHAGDKWVVSTNNGILVSADGGDSWHTLRKGDGETVYKLAYHEGTLYAMKGFAGC